MKKRTALTLLAAALLASGASADITVKLPQGLSADSVSVRHAPIRKIAAAKTRAEQGFVTESVAVTGNTAVIPTAPDQGGSMYYITVADNKPFSVAAAPADRLVAEVVSADPFEVNVTGNSLLAFEKKLDQTLDPVIERFRNLPEGATDEQRNALREDYQTTLNDFIQENLTDANVVVAIMNLSGEDFLAAMGRLPERAKTSLMYPLAQKQVEQTKERILKEQKQAAMGDGTHMAPDFTLEGLDGKPVSLSQFRGKWVILDFWGGWCIWCIRGIPELKEAYKQYEGELEIIGVDCNESVEDWKAAVAKYELPWVNVYCPKGNTLLEEFGIQGFPTKAIISPDGKVANITVGHNPEFYTALKELIGH